MSQNLFTPVGTCGYAGFATTPDAKGNKRIEIFFNADELTGNDATLWANLVEARDQEALEAFGKKNPRGSKPGITKVALDDDLDPEDEERLGWQRAFTHRIQPSSNKAVMFVDSDGSQIEAEQLQSKLYTGAKVRAVVRLASYDINDSSTGTKVQGIKAYLQALQFVADGERLFGGGRSADGGAASMLNQFAALFDGADEESAGSLVD